MFLIIYLIGCLISLITSIFVLYNSCNNKDYTIQSKRTAFVDNSGLVLVGVIFSWITVLYYILEFTFILFKLLFECISKKLFK